MDGNITLPVAAFMSAASSIASIGGTWALLQYKVQRAASQAAAAHRRIDEAEKNHGTLKDRVLILEQQALGHAKELERIAGDVVDRLEKLDKKLDGAIQNGVFGRKA